MLGEISRELRQISAGLDELSRPAEAGSNVARADEPNDFSKIARIKRAQHALGNLHGHLAAAKGNQLLKRGERVSHAAFRAMGDQLESLALKFHALSHANGAEAGNDRIRRDASEVETLATRMNGLRDLLRVRCGQNEHDVTRRLLKRFEQRVERRRGEHVNLVDDVDLVTAAGWRELHAPDDFLAHVLNARSACRVELVDVRMVAVRHGNAVLARAIGLSRGALLAEKRLGQQAGRGGLSRSARAREQVRMAYLVLFDGILDSSLNMLLANNVFEDLRPVFPIKSLCHERSPSVLEANPASSIYALQEQP